MISIAVACVVLLTPMDSLPYTEFAVPDEWDHDCTSMDSEGRTVVGCSRWNRDAGRNQAVLFLVGQSLDTVMIADERVLGITSIHPASDGGFLITCPLSRRETETAAAKLAPDGTVEWFTPVGQVLGNGYTYSTAFAETPGGGLLVGGNMPPGGGEVRYVAALLDGEGEVVWSLNGEVGEELDAALADETGVLLAGEMPGDDQTQAFARRFDLQGNPVWELTCDLGGFSSFKCVERASEGYFLGGMHFTADGQQYGLIVCAGDTGEELWRSLIDQPDGYQQSYVKDLTELGDGRVLAAGYSMMDSAPRHSDDGLVVVLNEAGEPVWLKLFGRPGRTHESLRHIHIRTDGGIVFLGNSWRGYWEDKRIFVLGPIDGIAAVD